MDSCSLQVIFHLYWRQWRLGKFLSGSGDNNNQVSELGRTMALTQAFHCNDPAPFQADIHQTSK